MGLAMLQECQEGCLCQALSAASSADLGDSSQRVRSGAAAGGLAHFSQTGRHRDSYLASRRLTKLRARDLAPSNAAHNDARRLRQPRPRFRLYQGPATHHSAMSAVAGGSAPG